jgi:hypothetical protein
MGTRRAVSLRFTLRKDKFVPRLVCILLAALFVLISCNGSPTETPPEPLDLLAQVASNIRATETFRMSVERTGANYFIETDFGSVIFQRTVAQYVVLNVMQATVRVLSA